MRQLPDLYVIRHGETEWNREHRWQGALDSPLTERGEAQARAVGALLGSLGIGPDTHEFWVSPQGRARRTAEIILDGGNGAWAEAALAEIGVGEFAGKTRAEIVALTGLPETADFLEYYRAAPGGESFEALFARVSGFLARLARPSVIVTHGITSRFLRTAALGWGLDRVAEVPGGQGVIHRIRDGRHETLVPEGHEG